MTWLSIPLLTTLVLCLSGASASAFASRSTSKRDSTSSPPPPPATLFMPLTLDENRRYAINVSLPTSSGPHQSFAFALTTSTGYSSVAAQGCVTCGSNMPTFSSPSSSTQTETGAMDVSVLNAGVAGPTISQSCNLLLRNGSAWSWVDQSFILANQSNSIFSSDVSGILGLGTNSRAGRFNETVMAFWLKNNPNQQNFSYGLALNPPNTPLLSSSSGGTLHWLAPDPSSYEGEISWKVLLSNTNMDTSSNSTSSLTNADSFVEMDSWVFRSTSQDVNVSDTTGSLLTVIDPLFPDIVFPQVQARAIYDTIPGSSLLNVLSGGTTAYSLPCNTTMQLNLTFGSVSAILTEAQLVRNLGNDSTTCVGVLEEWSSTDVTDYLLGASLISNIYLVFPQRRHFMIVAPESLKLQEEETSNLIPPPLSPPSDWLSNYLYIPGGGGSDRDRDSKRNTRTAGMPARQTFGQILEQLRLSSMPNQNQNQFRASDQTYYNDPNSPGQGLLIQVLSPPSLSMTNRYSEAQQQELEMEIERLLQNQNQDNNEFGLPPYRPTDPTPDARNWI
ncbi:hypothetical protein BT96DRAFT_982093 [Gymnopus androsaceus JB14]|uniref:Peptidase A1 domain-containing protein n=1 Tax=Gymnopus androsaceus JB14 TaxID=1447944 RepID=A0A6A4GIR8_9AGAR|nr:hypothetical protein BT96DRAFT_982093 [Gymnopus androsaceus JB14]